MGHTYNTQISTISHTNHMPTLPMTQTYLYTTSTMMTPTPTATIKENPETTSLIITSTMGHTYNTQISTIHHTNYMPTLLMTQTYSHTQEPNQIQCKQKQATPVPHAMWEKLDTSNNITDTTQLLLNPAIATSIRSTWTATNSTHQLHQNQIDSLLGYPTFSMGIHTTHPPHNSPSISCTDTSLNPPYPSPQAYPGSHDASRIHNCSTPPTSMHPCQQQFIAPDPTEHPKQSKLHTRTTQPITYATC